MQYFERIDLINVDHKKRNKYMTCFQNESIYIQKTHLLCDACIVYIDIAKLQMRFLHYAFFS